MNADIWWFERDSETHETSPWTLPRRGLCFVVIVALHAAVAWVAVHWRPAEEPAAEPAPSAIMIDLAPLPAAPPAPPADIPPGPEQQIAQPPPPPEPDIAPVMPPAPPAPAPNVAVPVPLKPVPPKRTERVVRHDPPAPRPDSTPPAPATTAPPRIEAQAAPAAAAPAPAPGAAMLPSTNAVPTWQGLLLRRLEQFKRYPPSAQFQRQQGVAQLRFTMNRSGRVLSAQIVKGSGFAALDEETLALVRRAEPLPAPPPGVPGDSISLVVPVQFFLNGGR